MQSEPTHRRAAAAVEFDAPILVGSLDDLTAVADVVIVGPDPDEERSGGGLYVPGLTHTTQTGVVLAVGPGRITKRGVRVPSEVSVGDRILYPRRDPAIKVPDGDDYRYASIVIEDEILAVVG